MKRVNVALAHAPYEVAIGPGALVEAGVLLADRARVAVVSQRRVADHWADRLMASLAEASAVAELFEIDDGEQAKSLGTVEGLCRRFAEWGLLRSDAIVALGGGVVGDVAGFAAAAYHRGIDYVQAPTTLLAQVDSSVGGKTGVNIPEGKNLVGAFHQPVAVVADLDTLTTLPERDFRSGLGEVLKYACVLDERLGTIILDDTEALLARDLTLLGEVVERSVAIKAEVVAGDERELTGLRSKLNYGHTLAHAIETLTGYRMSHGEAVAIGVVFAAELAYRLDRIDGEAVARHRRLVGALDLAPAVPAAIGASLSADAVVEQMRRDKKAKGGLTFVLAGEGGLDRVEDPAEKIVRAALATVGIER
ncbi:MAG TPA: 3-dehydroquinate synthase [Acidimicrobiia bacterium]|nr:3-dehydroquinate synthase [Acidimicrobiia bacterium]